MNNKTILTNNSNRHSQITGRFTRSFFRACLLITTIILLFTFHSQALKSSAKIESATWQDSNTLVLLWSDNSSYEVYRSDTLDGKYTLLGTSGSGFYVDKTVTHSNEVESLNEYYYRLGVNGVPVSAPVKSGYNSRNLSSVQIYMYHNFIPDEQVKSNSYSDYFLDYAITTSEFEQDLIFLKKNGFNVITSRDLLDYINGKTKLPQKSVIISIDDGTLSVYRYAFPLLKKYNIKVEFNLIGKNIDDATEPFLQKGFAVQDKRTAEDYCTWYEIKEMKDSGLVSIFSHTYALHNYGKDGRIGALPAEGEQEASYKEVIKKDYERAYSCINGWLGTNPTTFVYPYSMRNELSDKTLLEQAGYQILMAGISGGRVTKGNYFVDGAPSASYMRVMARTPRMTGTPLHQYIRNVYASDAANGVNINADVKTEEFCTLPYIDVNKGAWYYNDVYYVSDKKIMNGTSMTKFSPEVSTTRGMIVTLLYRLEGEPKVSGTSVFSDVPNGRWYTNAVTWAAKNNIVSGIDTATFAPDASITREQLAAILYRYTAFKGKSISKTVNLSKYEDHITASTYAVPALRWAVAEGLIGGIGSRLSPRSGATRAQVAAIFHRYCRNIE